MLVGSNSILTVPRVQPRTSSSKSSHSPQPQEAAKDMKTLRKISYQLVESEERGHLIRKLLAKGVGFREEEEFLKKERGKTKGGRQFDDKKMTVKLAMGEKLKDNYKFEDKLRRQKSKLTKRIVGMVGQESVVWKAFNSSVKRGSYTIRGQARVKMRNKFKFLTKKYGGTESKELAELSESDQQRYGGAWIFDENKKWDKIEAVEPCVIRGEDKSMGLSDDERNLLKLGPKFCVLARLCDEEFEVELEQALMKVRWDMLGEEKKNKNKNLGDVAIEAIQDDDEKEECREYEEVLDAKTRMVYNVEKNVLDYGKRRTTDVKKNARVIFPRTGSFQVEAKFELIRIEAMQVFEEYAREKCGKGGKQHSNLNKSEQRGLKSLLKRTKEGEIVVLPTDKTGNFSVMDRARYEEAGLSHVKKDQEVGWAELRQAQKELNGHTSMLIKIFKIGSDWNHGQRVRESMLGNSLEVCPVHLLFKDHKGWSEDKGGVPPTRHVAGGDRGMNLHISEIVSDILEPMVGRVEGGQEIISTEDGLSTFEDINVEMEGWSSTSWWDGLQYKEMVACGKCEESEGYTWTEDKPDLCRCVDVKPYEDKCERDEEAAIEGQDRLVEDNQSNGGEDTPKYETRCSYKYIQTLRRLDWEKSVEWEEDEDRILDSTEVLEEDLQDYSVPMVVIGSDVVNLYPNLDVEKIVERVADEVERTDMSFSNVDYLESTRYLVLNWTQEECRRSGLLRVLPWRRKNRGTRPGITGSGPRGGERGDQEQWVFPRVTLEDWEKKKIVASVIKLATEAMFRKHFYSFGGKNFHQAGGGPIGLRGTCSVARLIMQIFDRKWGDLLKDLCVKIYGNIRYMDDGRTVLPPFKVGWRWYDGRIVYCMRWAKEDESLSSLERTRRIILGSMEKIEEFLSFTTETEEDFSDGWLPTLDVALRVSPQNQIEKS